MRCDLQIFSGCVCHLEQLHAQSPFLFPIVFSINLIPFFDICSVDYLLFFHPGCSGMCCFTWAAARSQQYTLLHGRRGLAMTRSATCKGYRPYVHETSYLLAFAWLQVTRSARGPGGPRADRVTCNHAKANSDLSSAQGRYLACFTRSRCEHKMRSNLAPCFTLTFQFEDVMC